MIEASPKVVEKYSNSKRKLTIDIDVWNEIQRLVQVGISEHAHL